MNGCETCDGDGISGECDDGTPHLCCECDAGEILGLWNATRSPYGDHSAKRARLVELCKCSTCEKGDPCRCPLGCVLDAGEWFTRRELAVVLAWGAGS